MTLFWLLYYKMEQYCVKSWSANVNSFWAFYVAKTEAEKYWYLSYLLSTVNSIVCVIIWYPVQVQCAPPATFRRDVFMGNTSLRNDWCNDNPNLYDIAGVA